MRTFQEYIEHYTNVNLTPFYDEIWDAGYYIKRCSFELLSHIWGVTQIFGDFWAEFLWHNAAEDTVIYTPDNYKCAMRCFEDARYVQSLERAVIYYKFFDKTSGRIISMHRSCERYHNSVPHECGVLGMARAVCPDDPDLYWKIRTGLEHIDYQEMVMSEPPKTLIDARRMQNDLRKDWSEQDFKKHYRRLRLDSLEWRRGW